jgi:hypothetical protein
MTVNVKNYTRVRLGQVEQVSGHSRTDPDFHQPLNSHVEGYPPLLGELITKFVLKGYKAADAVVLATRRYDSIMSRNK